jgi:hypothetical protein
VRSQSRHGWTVLAVALVTLLTVGCFSLAADYSPVTALLQPQKGAVSGIIQLLNQGKDQEATQALDALHDAVTQARALLNGTHFTGSTNMLTDPFSLPAGTYRVHVVTAGYLAAKAFPVTNPDNYDRIFNFFEGQATDGMTALYVSNGQRIMVEISNTSAPYELWFKKMS